MRKLKYIAAQKILLGYVTGVPHSLAVQPGLADCLLLFDSQEAKNLADLRASIMS